MLQVQQAACLIAADAPKARPTSKVTTGRYTKSYGKEICRAPAITAGTIDWRHNT